MNYDFGIVNEGKITYAPSSFTDSDRVIVNPSKDTYGSHGWLPNVRPEPNPPEGKVVSGSHWETDDATNTLVWEYTDAPQSVRTFSKLRMYMMINQLGYWDKVKEWLSNSGLWDAFQLAQDVREDNKQFVQGLSAVKSAIGISDEEIEKILDQSVDPEA